MTALLAAVSTFASVVTPQMITDISTIPPADALL